MLRRFLFFLLIQLFTFTAISHAQNIDTLVNKIVQGSEISDILLPLYTMQKLATENSPLMKFYNSDIIISELDIKTEKRNWMSALYIESGVKYGVFDNLIITEDLNTESKTSSTEQTRYYVGLSLKIPLSKFADRTNVQRAKAKLDKFRYQKANIEKDLRQLVIIRYNNVLKSNVKVEITNKALGIFILQMLDVEKNYVNGKIDITEYSRVNEIKMNAELDFEESKLELVAAIQLLNEIVGESVIIKK